MSSRRVELRDHYFPGTEELLPDEMRIIALGTGRPFARPAQANASWLVELGSGEKFIFDFGYGSFKNFAALELPMSDVTAMFASHLHSDHVGDFGVHWIASWMSGRTKPLHVLGPSGETPEHGIKHFVQHQMASYKWDSVTRHGHFPIVGEQVEVEEFDWASQEVVYKNGDVVVRSFPAVHFHAGAVGFRLEWRGLSFVYSGDTAPNSIFVENARGADVVVHEVFNTTKQLMERTGYTQVHAKNLGSKAHTQPREAGGVFAASKPRLAVAYHFFNDFDTVGEIEADIRVHYQGELALAQDLMVFNVTPDSIVQRMTVAAAHVWPNKSKHEEYQSAARGATSELPEWLEETRLSFD